MLNIQGFISLSKYASNTQGVVSKTGELSNLSRTYSTDQGIYFSNKFPEGWLTTFSVTSDALSASLVLSQVFADEVFEIINSMVTFAETRNRPYDKEEFFNTIRSEFLLKIDGLEFGPIVFDDRLDLPSYVSWKSIANDYSSIKLWFSDEIFRSQYLGYEIRVVPPIEDLDSFFLPFNDAKTLLENQSFSAFGARIEKEKKGKPETSVKFIEVDLLNKYDTRQKIKTVWGVVLYGLEGDYIDTIKDTIVDYVLSKSKYSKQNWELYFPDLFKRDEIILVPRWDKVAVENLSGSSVLYSPLTNLQESLNFTANFLSFYDKDYVLNNCVAFPYVLKSVFSLCVVGSSNSKEKKDFLKLYPDYMSIPSTSLDFARMKIKTQELVLFLDDLFLAAENKDPQFIPPETVHRVLRNKKIFMTSTHDGINFLVASKSNKEFSANV